MATKLDDSHETLDDLRQLVGQLEPDGTTPKKKTNRRGILKVAGAALIGAAQSRAGLRRHRRQHDHRLQQHRF